MFIKNIDQLGRIVIPSDIRKKLGVDVGDALDLNLKNNTIIISKHYNSQLDEVISNVTLLEDVELRDELMNTIFNHKRSKK